MSKKLLIAASCMAAALTVVPSAQAAYPGANGRIVFTNSTGIASANPDGSGFTQLTTNSETTSDQEPAWSADGTKIVFSHLDSSGEFNETIWTMNADGSGAAQVPRQGPATDGGPYLFPDGRIVFVRETPVDLDPEIWIMNADGSGQTQLTDNDSLDFGPTVSPDGQTIAFGRQDDTGLSIYRMDPNGANVSPITTDHTGPAVCDLDPNYSPDGSTLVFTRAQGPQGCEPVLNLYTVPAGGGAGAPLTNSTVSGEDTAFATPAYSPDGSQIVFANVPPPTTKEPAAAVDPRVAPSSGQLGFISAAGGEPTAYLDGSDPDWQPVKGVTDLGTCFGRKVTIAGTPGNDKIVGTPGNDVIRGFRGNDKIIGKGGDDVLCGGRGKDRLFGKGGDDILIGGEKSDYLNGGKGSNRLFGGTPGAHPESADNVCVKAKGDKLKNCQTVK